MVTYLWAPEHFTQMDSNVFFASFHCFLVILCTSAPVFLFKFWGINSLVSVVSYWESFCSSYMSTSTRARAGPSITLLMFSLAKASANRSPRPHTDWSSRIAAWGGYEDGEIGEAEDEEKRERIWTGEEMPEKELERVEKFKIVLQNVLG